jgi:hypothetical protein
LGTVTSFVDASGMTNDPPSLRYGAASRPRFNIHKRLHFNNLFSVFAVKVKNLP